MKRYLVLGVPAPDYDNYTAVQRIIKLQEMLDDMWPPNGPPKDAFSRVVQILEPVRGQWAMLVEWDWPDDHS